MSKATPANDDLAEYARRLVADWPPLTPEQRVELRAALHPGVNPPHVESDREFFERIRPFKESLANRLETTGPWIGVDDYDRPAVSGYVYFVGAEDGSGLIKIGYSKTPEKRLLTLQAGSMVALKLLGKIFCEDSAGHERELHERFSHLREHGEWFRRAPELLEMIESL